METDIKDYVETETRYTVRGRELHFRYQPSKMPSYSLAKAIYYKKAEKPEIHAEILVSRFSDYIDNLLARHDTRSNKPTKQEKEKFKHRAATFKHIVRTNIYNIIEDALEDRYPYEYSENIYYDGEIVRPITRGERAVNNMLFNRNFQLALQGLSSSTGFNKVWDDYTRVQSLLADPKGFDELKEWSDPLIHKWTWDYPIRGVDREDQYQQGLITLWSAAPNYKGKNFARFMTFLKGALRYKFLNMLRFSYADKRRINRDTMALGSATNSADSYYAHLLDEISCLAWQIAQMENYGNGHYDPFSTTHINDMIKVRRGFDQYGIWRVTARDEPGWERNTFDGFPDRVLGDEITEDDFPLLDEKAVRLFIEHEDLGLRRPIWYEWDDLTLRYRGGHLVIGDTSRGFDPKKEL